jgi:aminopeptidase N
MKNFKSLALALLFLVLYNAGKAETDPYPKNPNIDALNYIFEITLSDETDEIKMNATIDVRFLADGVKEIRLDLIKKSAALEGKGMTVAKVMSGGKSVTFRHENDAVFIVLPTPSKKNQRNQFTISYSGIPATGLKIAPNKHGDRTFFSDNWPNKGRNWLSTIDHPSDKSKCEFIVTAPNHYQVVSNGLKVEDTDLGDGNRLTHWRQGIPIASWLYVLGVAEFAVQQVDDFDGKAIETWVYRQDRDAGFYDFAEPTKKVLEFYSDYVGPFSYERLANIQSNSVGGGMEAASAILYGDNSVTGTRSIRWRNVVIHEIAHQWFGNAVTEYDWDDVWLSEGFATYFTLLFIEHQYGRDEFVEGLKSSKKRIDDFSAKNPEYTIVHNNLADMSNVVTGQIYQKGSWTLHMLRGKIGTDNFWKGIKTYYAEFQNKNATTADFIRHMEEASDQDLGQFFNQWLHTGATLKYAGNWAYNKKSGTVEVKIEQSTTINQLFVMPLQIGIEIDGQPSQIETVQVDKKSNTYSFKVASAPENVVLDPNTWVLMDADFKKK